MNRFLYYLAQNKKRIREREKNVKLVESDISKFKSTEYQSNMASTLTKRQSNSTSNPTKYLSDHYGFKPKLIANQKSTKDVLYQVNYLLFIKVLYNSLILRFLINIKNIL